MSMSEEGEIRGHTIEAFVGVSDETESGPATLEKAIYDAALQAARAGLADQAMQVVHIEFGPQPAYHAIQGDRRARKLTEASSVQSALGLVSFMALKPPSSATVTSATTPLRPSKAMTRLLLRIPRRRIPSPARPTGPRAIVKSRFSSMAQL